MRDGLILVTWLNVAVTVAVALWYGVRVAQLLDVVVIGVLWSCFVAQWLVVRIGFAPWLALGSMFLAPTVLGMLRASCS